MDAEERRRDRVRKALGNPLFFATYYLQPYDPNWPDGEGLPEFAADMLRFIVRADRGVIMLPVEHLKTTIGSQHYPIWRTFRAAYFKEQLRGLLFSEEQGMAAANLSVITWHIEHNEHLQRDFVDDAGRPLVYPSVQEDTWRQDAIIIQRPHPSKDPTWQAKGLDGKGIHGRRLDLFIGDDIVTPRNAHSPAMRKDALDTFDLQVRTRLVAGAQALVLGNYNDSKDLLSVLSRRRRWRLFKRPGFHLPDQPTVAPDESQLYSDQAIPLWGSNWPADRLLEEYEETPNRFKRIFLQDERAEQGETLKTGWLQAIDPEQTQLADCRVFMFVDPAPGGETDDLDYVDVAVGIEQPGGLNLDVVGLIDFRAKLPDAIKRMGAIYDRFRRVGMGVVAIGCGKVAMDNFFRDAVTMGRPDLAPLMFPIPLPGNKEQRLQGLGPFASSGYLRFWEEVLHALTSDEEDQRQELAFWDQWRDFSPAGGLRHDDKLDGLDGLIRTAREFVGGGDRVVELEAV